MNGIEKPAPISLRGFKSIMVLDMRDLYSSGYDLAKHIYPYMDVDKWSALLRDIFIELGRRSKLVFVASSPMKTVDECLIHEFESIFYRRFKSIVRSGVLEPDELYVTIPGDLWLCWREYRT